MTKGPSEKCRCGDENSSFRAKIAKDDKGVSGTDTSRRSESFAAERLNLQSQGCFSEGPKEIEIKILGIEKTAFEKAVKKAGGKNCLINLKDSLGGWLHFLDQCKYLFSNELKLKFSFLTPIPTTVCGKTSSPAMPTKEDLNGFKILLKASGVKRQ